MTELAPSNPAFTIVLPCFNPSDGWAENVVNTTLKIENNLAITANLVIVIDGSEKHTDASHIAVIKEAIPSATIIAYANNKGKGFALRTGVKAVKHFPIIYTDIDFPYTEKSFEAVYKELNNGYDTVLGKRDTSYYKNTPWVRKIISKTLRAVLKYFLKLPTDDSQCGIKGFNQNGAKVFLETEINRFLFDLEFVKLISKRGLSCKTVPVELKPNIVFSKVNFRILAKESVNFVKVLFRK
ncbi:MAG: glycosyltransferase [Putridiphycobacter sp.]|nr:glycosyltransferase [Putridiphycobacter sp.]